MTTIDTSANASTSVTDTSDMRTNDMSMTTPTIDLASGLGADTDTDLGPRPAARPSPSTEAFLVPEASAGIVTTALAVAARTIKSFMRTPQVVVTSAISGAMFLLIFRYIFSGAMDTGGISAVSYIVSGFVVTGILFTGADAAAGVATDAEAGLNDRFRSLPISRTAVLFGRSLADTTLLAWGLTVTTLVGFAVGFRVETSLVEGLAAFALCVLFGAAFTWLFIALGLLAGNAQAAQGMSLLVFPLSFVSSAFVPVDSLPGWIQPVAEHQPLTAMVGTVRSLVLDDAQAVLGHSTGWFLVRALLWCVASVAVFLPVAVRRFGSE